MRTRGGGGGALAVALVFAGLQALAFGGRFVLALLAAPVSHALRLDDLQMGLLLGTAFIVPFCLATPAFGVLTDRHRGGTPLVAGLAIATAASACAAMAQDFGALLAARALLGVGEAAIAPAALVRIAAAASPGRSAGLGVGLFAAGGPIGKGVVLTAGGAGLGALAAAGGGLAPWREVLWAATGLHLLAAAAAWRLRPPSTRDADPSARPRPRAGAPTDRRRLAAAAVAGVAAVLVSQTTAAWAPSLFGRVWGLTPAQAGVLTGAPLLLLAPAGGLATGWALDRAAAGGRRPPAVPVLVAGLAGAGAGALGLAAAPNLAWAQALFSLLAAAGGAGAVAALRGVQLYAGDAARARTTALYIAAANLVGFGVGPPLVGWLARPSGLRWALGEVSACAALAGVAAAFLLAPGRRAETGGSAAPS